MKLRLLFFGIGLLGFVGNTEAGISANQNIRSQIFSDIFRLGITYQDISAATRVMYLEDQKNMDTIAYVLKNRAEFDKTFEEKYCGPSFKNIVKCPGQFKTYYANQNLFSNNALSLFFNVGEIIPKKQLVKAYNILIDVLEGRVNDRTNGATYFGTSEIKTGTHLFNLKNGKSCYAEFSKQIGGHTFYKPICK